MKRIFKAFKAYMSKGYGTKIGFVNCGGRGKQVAESFRFTLITKEQNNSRLVDFKQLLKTRAFTVVSL